MHKYLQNICSIYLKSILKKVNKFIMLKVITEKSDLNQAITKINFKSNGKYNALFFCLF
jgi:hypothetical protein